MEDMIIEENSEMVDDIDRGRPQKVLHDCPKCSRSFANIGHMKCHFYRVHPEFKLTEFVECEIPDSTKVCRLCGAGFETRRDLNKHDCPGWEDGSRAQTYLCAHCDRRFANKTSLQLHCMRQHRQGAKHTCALCQKGFASAPNLAAHMRIHSLRGEEVFAAPEEDNGEVPDVKKEAEEPAPPPPAFRCDVCGEGFKTMRSLKSHASNFHEEAVPPPPVRCDICEDVFADAASLKEHRLEEHPVEKTFACDVCPTLFASHQALATHKRVHEPKGSQHKCDVCGTGFSTKLALATHAKKHSSKEKKFACATCGKKFPLKCHLSRHLKTHD